MTIKPKLLAAIASAIPASIIAFQALAEPNRVRFPENLDALEHFTTVTRGEVTEHMLTTSDAIAAAQAGEDMPDGTQIILADYRDDALYRLFVMEKGPGWGDEYAEDRRTADWQFQWYWPDGSVNMDENTERCRACHQGRADENYMFTYNDLMKYQP